jgi:thiamine-monophosphate kinase
MSLHAVVVSVSAVGSVKRRKILRRDGARPGDELWVSGVVGSARAGLEWLQAHGGAGEDETLRSGRERYLRPQPRTRLGMQLGRTRAARAAIDVSDGLADGVRQIARAGQVGAIVEAADVPIDPETRGWFQRRGVDPVTAALTGGDDYELLFVVPKTGRRRLTTARRLVGGLPLTKIGEITKDPVVRLRRNGREEDLPEGFEHFRGGATRVGAAG